MPNDTLPRAKPLSLKPKPEVALAPPLPIVTWRVLLTTPAGIEPRLFDLRAHHCRVTSGGALLFTTTGDRTVKAFRMGMWAAVECLDDPLGNPALVDSLKS